MANEELRKAKETIRTLEAALKAAEEKYRLLFDNTREGVSVHEEFPNGIKLVECNDRYVEMSGCSHDELMQMGSVSKIQRDLNTPEQNAAKARKIKAGHPHSGAFSWERPDGKENYVEYVAIPFSAGDKKLILEIDHNVTERELAEEALRETEERYRILTNILNIGVYRNTPGPDGQFIEMNDAHARMFGYRDKSELLGTRVADLYQNPEDRVKFSARLSRIGFMHEELRLKKKDGTPIVCLVSSVASRDEDGNVLYFDGIIEDITDLRQAEKGLQEMKDRYRILVENANEAIVVAQNGMLQYVNPKAMEITGYTEEELTSRPFTDFIHPEDRGIIRERFLKRLRGAETPNIYLFRVIDRYGNVKWVQINSALIPWTERPAVLSLMTDMTDQKEAEKALWESRERYRLQMEYSYDGISTIGSDGVIRQLNSTAAMEMGGAPDDFIGKSLYDLFPKEQADEFMSSIQQIVSSGIGHTKERLVLLPTGNKWISSKSQPIIEPDGSILSVQVITQDITQHKQAQERENQARAQGRLEVVDTILHNIGNAINSVTTGIGTIQRNLESNILTRRLRTLANAVKEHQDNFSDYVKNHSQGQKVAPFIIGLADDFEVLDEELARIVARVEERADRIAEIIRTQKALSGGSSYSKDVNLTKAIDNAVSVLQDTIDKRKIKVISDCSMAPEEIETQESQFHQMMVNLIKNSVEAIDDLEELEGSLKEQPFIKITCRTESDSLILEVTDNGIGIEEDKLEAIFRSDYTTKRSGSGLGLHSIANFINARGGRIQALSDGIGKGATIRVVFSLSSAVKSAGLSEV